PLGGSRNGERQTYRNLLLTFLLGGLWHGASFTFVIWGGIHGGFLCVERYAKKTFAGVPWPAVAGWFVTFNVVCIAWVFFRSPDLSTAFSVLGGVGLGGPSPLVTPLIVRLIVGPIAMLSRP